MSSQIVSKTLANGMRVLIEPMPGARSAAITWLIPAGPASEPPDRRGLAAMWEELLFRGAGELDSRTQADALDRCGVSRSLTAGSRHLSLGATFIGARLDEALPLVVDMVRRPRFDEASIEPARQLALQGLESLQDEPRERAQLLGRERHLPEPLGRSAYGTAEGLRAITRDDVAGQWRARARPGGSILGVAGAVDPDHLIDRLERLLSGWEGEADFVEPRDTPQRGYAHETDDSNQVQIIVLHDAPREEQPTSVVERIASAVLSGGMSGRLFTEVREKRGLCYAVSAGYAGGRDFGTVQAYVGTTPERAQESLDVLLGELRRVGDPGGEVTREEFDRAVVGLKSRLVFSGESTSARASALALDQHRLGRARTLEEITEAIDATTLDQVNEYLRSRDLGRLTIQTLGPQALRAPENP